MAIRARATVTQNASNVVLTVAVGQDGSLPANAPGSGVEFANLADLKQNLLDFEASFTADEMAKLGLLLLLHNAQGDVTQLAGKTVSTVWDTDAGQVGLRITQGS